MGHSAIQSLKDVPQKPDLVVVSPSAPDAMMKFPAECRELGIQYLYDPSQQVLRLEGSELARDMEGARFLFCNDYEFELISKKTGRDLKETLKHVQVLVITRGKEGANLYTDGQEFFIPTVPEREIVDPTGVGDAFRGGLPGRLWTRLGLDALRRGRLRWRRCTVLRAAARRATRLHERSSWSASDGTLRTEEGWTSC